MSAFTAPERILSRGSIGITWHRAAAKNDIVIPYPEPKPPTIYPAGTSGWWRPTGDRWGEFLPDDTRSGVAMLTSGLDISDEYEQVTYNLSPLYWEADEE